MNMVVIVKALRGASGRVVGDVYLHDHVRNAHKRDQSVTRWSDH